MAVVEVGEVVVVVLGRVVVVTVGVTLGGCFGVDVIVVLVVVGVLVFVVEREVTVGVLVAGPQG